MIFINIDMHHDQVKPKSRWQMDKERKGKNFLEVIMQT